MTTIDRQWLLEQTQQLGFTRMRIAPIGDPAAGIHRYDEFLRQGRHAGMEWMVRGRDARADPRGRVPDGRSAVVLGIDYGGVRPADPGGLTGMVASYAWGRDYHNVVGRRIRKLVRRVSAHGVRMYGGVDSRPIIERAWAEQSGHAFLGKNCCAIVPGYGSFFFLAVLLVDIPLEADPPIAGMSRHCGSCRRCFDACPTDAFVDAGQLDARRCISYWTIEHRGLIDADLGSKFGRWVFGCDVCQEVCPHNTTPKSDIEEAFQPRPGHAWLDLEWVLNSDDQTLDSALEGSPLRRAKPQGLKRNAAIVLGNLGDIAARAALRRAADGADPVVATQASRSLARLD